MSSVIRYGFMLAVIASFIGTQNTFSQSNSSDASVQQLRAVLKSIHPYLPKKDVTGEIDVFGSTTMDSLASGWAVGFKKFHPDAKVVISAEGSETTFERLAKNPSSIGMLSRPVTEDDLAELRELGLKRPAAIMVAREALGVFVHESNPMESINYAGLVRIFCSEDPSDSIEWKEIGLDGDFGEQTVELIGRTRASGTRAFIKRFVFDGKKQRKLSKSTETSAMQLDALAKSPGGITISPLKQTKDSTRILSLRADKLIIPSDDHSVLVGKYPLVSPLTLVLDLDEESEQATANREFIRYATSHPGQVQAILSGFFPFDPPTLQAQRLKLDPKPASATKTQEPGKISPIRSTRTQSTGEISR